eukprot:11385046-Alexandrium_andersonii.AAC.1
MLRTSRRGSAGTGRSGPVRRCLLVVGCRSRRRLRTSESRASSLLRPGRGCSWAWCCSEDTCGSRIAEELCE